jgi:hypothetical protein
MSDAHGGDESTLAEHARVILFGAAIMKTGRTTTHTKCRAGMKDTLSEDKANTCKE